MEWKTDAQSNSLRALQLCELEILKAVKVVCEKNGITYFLSSGTLLGAIRHGGFIPWDDDVDIAMPIEDYNRFISIAQEELGDSFFVQNSETDHSFHQAFSKIRMNNTTMMSPWEKGMPGHHGVWIDVFPLIYTGKGLDFKFKSLLLTINNILLMSDPAFERGRGWLESQSSKFRVKIAIIVRKIPISVRRFFCRALRKRILNGRKKPYFSTVWGNITNQYSVSILEDEPDMVMFENELFPAYKDWDGYLQITYGDYMTPPPENQRNGGHGDVIIDLEHGWE